MNEKEYLTQEKFDEFKKELADLKGARRKEVAENLEYAKALGDLSENAEYHEARDAQATVEDRIMYLEDLLKNAVIVSQTNTTGGVSVGSVVTVEKDKKAVTYTIVGSEESNVAEGKISVRSPFGQAIIGKKEGDHFSYTTGTGEFTYKIKEVK